MRTLYGNMLQLFPEQSEANTGVISFLSFAPTYLIEKFQQIFKNSCPITQE